MVMDRESGNEEVDEDISDDYWERRYSIIPQNVPTFLKAYDNNILRTGKYLNVIRQSGMSLINFSVVFSLCMCLFLFIYFFLL